MYISKSRHGVFYFRKDGRRKSLNTRSKREAVVKAAEIITGNERPMMTVNHAGVEIIVNGETMEQELAVVQAITTTKISREPRAPRMNVTEKWTSSLTQ